MPDFNSIQPAESQSANVQVYCPSEIVDIFNDFLSRTGMGTKVVLVTGIFLKTAKQVYSGYYYDTLKDQNSDQELSLRIPQSLRDGLDNGSLVTIGGTIYRQPGNRGSIQLGLKVSRVETLQQQAVSEEDMKRAELRSAKKQKGFKNVESLLESILMRGERRPRVALIFAEASITRTDFDCGKRAAEASYDIEEYRANFSRPQEVCGLLDRLDGSGYDVLALVRGGGSGIECLDNLDILAKVAVLKTPVICAVGHPEERLFIKVIADAEVPTPTGLGQWLSDLAEKVSKTRQDSIAVITKQVEKQFSDRIATQEKQNKELHERLSALTKQAEASQKQTGESNRNLQNQLTEANKKNGELARQIETQAKSHAEQMKTLNETLSGFKKESAVQAAKQNETLTSLQKNYRDLQQQNTRLSSDLVRAREDLAKASSGSGKVNGLTVVLMIVAVILLIALIVK